MFEEQDSNSHNSMKEYRYHDIGSVLLPVPEESMKLWTDKIQALLNSHKKPEIDIWRGIA